MADQHAHDRRSYPPARLSMTPLFSLPDLFGRPLDGNPFLQAGSAIIANGRTAVAHALRLLGIGPGHQVLVPAYHCPAMIEPVNWCGATPVFYPLDDALDVDVARLDTLRGDATRAVMAAHFFAQARDLAPLRQWCDQHGIALIEDCAHALFSQIDGRPVGEVGDYSVASLWKFLPTGEGGVLHRPRADLPDLGLQPGAGDIKALFRLLEEASDKGHAGLLKPTFMLLNHLRGGGGGHGTGSSAPGGSSASAYALSDAQVFRAAPELVEHLRDTAFSAADADRRRAVYARLRDALAHMPGCELYPLQLGPADVPYVLPLLLDEPDRQFPALKMAGCPVWRWEDLLTDVCPVSEAYRWRLIQLPCHQDLSDADVDWLLSTIEVALTA